jgi:hypothetical protein
MKREELQTEGRGWNEPNAAEIVRHNNQQTENYRKLSTPINLKNNFKKGIASWLTNDELNRIRSPTIPWPSSCQNEMDNEPDGPAAPERRQRSRASSQQ